MSVMLLVAAVSALGLSACDTSARSSSAMAGGDDRRGLRRSWPPGVRRAMQSRECSGAADMVGSPLDQVARRSYIAGGADAPDRLVELLRRPRQVCPGTPMREMGVTEGDALDIAAYLYTLK